jgi:hypothetical protein
MAAKITREILEGYLECRYNGQLRLAGEQEERSDYERMTSEEEAESRTRGLAHLLSCHPKGEAHQGTALTAVDLGRGPPVVLDAIIEDEQRPCVSTGSSGWRGSPGLATSTTPRSFVRLASPSGSRRGTCWPSWGWSWAPSRGGSPPPVSSSAATNAGGRGSS